MKGQGQGQYQSNPFFKIAVAQAHVAAFFGFVEATREYDKDVSDLKLADKFITKYNLDLDAASLSQRYTSYKLNMIQTGLILQNKIK